MIKLDRRKFLTNATAIAATATTRIARTAPLRHTQRSANWIPAQEVIASVPTLMKAATLPGLSIAAVEDGVVTWTQSFGVLNAKTMQLVQRETLFEAASMSKAVFAYGVLQLVEQKKLELDRTLASYFRPSYLPDYPELDQITIRHVLTHSSGLPNWGDEQKPETFKLAFPPGHFFSYSGEGIFWLQLVAEHVTGQGLDTFMRSQLFEPAGMKHSSFVLDMDSAATAAWGHQSGRVSSQQGTRNVLKAVTPFALKWDKPLRDWTQKDWVRVGLELDPKSASKRIRFENAAASLVTTASDYATFLTLMMEHRPRASWEISESMRQAMISPQIAVQKDCPLWWGLGWTVEHGVDGLQFGHEGNNDGRFTSYAGGSASHGRGLVILANDGSGFGVYQRIVRAVTGSDQLSFVANLNPQAHI